MNIEKKRATIINVVYYAMLLAIFYLLVKYAFWLFFPVVISFLVALILQKPVNAITKKTPLKKGLASTICVLLLIVAIIGVFVLIGASAINYLKGFAEYIRGLFGNMDDLIYNLRTWLISVSQKLPDTLSKNLTENINSFFSRLDPATAGSATQAVTDSAQTAGGFSLDISKITSWLTTPLSSVLTTAMQIPTMLLNVLITVIMSCFLTADFDMVSAFLMAQLSKKKQEDFKLAKHLLKTTFLKMIKAYCLIILVTFTEMLIGLGALYLTGIFRSSYIIIIAAVTAVVDILPVLGTGTIIFPWAAYSLITGKYALAIGLIVIYIIIAVIRQIIEPKLVAGQLGLPPFMTIIGLFVGLKLFGFIGMLIMPIFIVMIKLLNDNGIIHLWKSSEAEAKKAEAEAEKSGIKINEPKKENK